MPSLNTLLVYIPVAVVMAFTPGPATLFVMSRASSLGRRAGLAAAAGLLSGTCVLIGLAAAGLTGVLAASPTAFAIVKDAGAAYLVYLGIRLWAATGGLEAGGSAAPDGDPGWREYRRGVITEFLNPKIALFYASVLPQFVDAGRGDVPLQMAVLGGVFCVFAVVSLTLIACGGGALRARIARDPRWLTVTRRASGVVLVGLGVRLAAGGAR